MMTDARLKTLEYQMPHLTCLDQRELFAEIQRLRFALSRFTDGFPNPIHLNSVANMAEDYCDDGGETHEIIRPALKWIRRVAQGEVGE